MVVFATFLFKPTTTNLFATDGWQWCGAKIAVKKKEQKKRLL
jgi:hypothetical protein